MYIWRVAHPEHTYQGFPSGPYVSAGLTPEIVMNMRPMGDAHSWEPSHPSPISDPELCWIKDDERCGFISLDALFDWFEGFINLLRENGFIMYVYEVPECHVRIGAFGQVIFHCEYADEICNVELGEEEAA